MKNFAGINFRESTFAGVKKGIYFRELGQNSRKSRNFLLAKISSLNGLQVNGGVFDREFTKSLIIRDFDDVLKNPFRYVALFLLHTLLSKKISKNRHARPVTEGPKLRCNTSPPRSKYNLWFTGKWGGGV